MLVLFYKCAEALVEKLLFFTQNISGKLLGHKAKGVWGCSHTWTVCSLQETLRNSLPACRRWSVSHTEQEREPGLSTLKGQDRPVALPTEQASRSPRVSGQTGQSPGLPRSLLPPSPLTWTLEASSADPAPRNIWTECLTLHPGDQPGSCRLSSRSRLNDSRGGSAPSETPPDFSA